MLRNPRLLSRYGSDLLLPFTIRRPVQTDEEAHALQVATRLAKGWWAKHQGRILPPNTPPSELLDLIQGLYALKSLGLNDGGLHKQVVERCASWRAADFLRYDPRTSEPSPSLREDCACGSRPANGSSFCAECKRPSIPMSSFDVYLEAVVHTFHGCRMGIPLGACFFDVVRQLAAAMMKADADCSETSSLACAKDRHYSAYALTHVIYALSNFDERSLPPELFPQRLRTALFLRLNAALAAKDPDLSAELLDCLNAIGESESKEAKRAVQFIMKAQKPDGGWQCEGESDQFSRFHASLVAVGALLRHSYLCCEPIFPTVSLVLPRWFEVDGAAESMAAKEACKNGTLCLVDHTQAGTHEAFLEAEAATSSLEIRWPLREVERKYVTMLPVHRRIDIRTRLLRDKMQQNNARLREVMRAEADERYLNNPAVIGAGPSRTSCKDVCESDTRCCMSLATSRARTLDERRKVSDLHTACPSRTSTEFPGIQNGARQAREAARFLKEVLPSSNHAPLRPSPRSQSAPLVRAPSQHFISNCSLLPDSDQRPCAIGTRAIRPRLTTASAGIRAHRAQTGPFRRIEPLAQVQVARRTIFS